MGECDVARIASKILDEEKFIIAYRPSWKAMTGSVNATILLQQVRHWWIAQDRKPFYKFFEPPRCGHKMYRSGDSWTEELGFTMDELRGALKRVGKRLTKKDLEDLPAALADVFFGYFQDQVHLTWFYFNDAYFEQKLVEHYRNECRSGISPDGSFPDGNFPDGKSLPGQIGNSDLAGSEKSTWIHAETPTKTPTKKTINDISLDSFFGPSLEKPGPEVSLSAHQRAIDAACQPGSSLDPVEEVAKHLCWGIRGLAAELPTGKKERKRWTTAAEALLSETNKEDWHGVCAAVDEWFTCPPEADEWKHDNATAPHHPIDAIARYYFGHKAKRSNGTVVVEPVLAPVAPEQLIWQETIEAMPQVPQNILQALEPQPRLNSTFVLACNSPSAYEMLQGRESLRRLISDRLKQRDGTIHEVKIEVAA